MVDIKTSTLRSNVYETLYDTVTAANLLSSTVTVTAAYIDDNKTFPQVVINPIDMSEDEYTFTRAYGKKTLISVIDIYTKKNKDIDTISDQLYTTIRDMSAQGIMLVNWNESTALETPNDNKVHLKSISLEFRR